MFLGSAGVFPFLFPVLVFFLYTSCILRGTYTFFINFSDYLSQNVNHECSNTLQKGKVYSTE